MKNNDYFAKKLLSELDQKDPIFAAYEAQKLSADVGFDFNHLQDVLPRALDEIREAKEALIDPNDVDHSHFGDEIADIVFSVINLVRHCGINDMPSYRTPEHRDIDPSEIYSELDIIAGKMNALGELDKVGNDNTSEAALDLLQYAIRACSAIALNFNFELRSLIVQNVRKYLVRCEAIEILAERDSKTWKNLADNKEIIVYWKKAKEILA